MRAKKCSPYPELFNPDESKKATKVYACPILSYLTWIRVLHSTYPEIFNSDGSKKTVTPKKLFSGISNELISFI
jgi:hypothetical protein